MSWLLFRLLAVVGCAVASYYFIERPMTRLGHRLRPPATPGHIDLAAGQLKAVSLVQNN